MTIKEALEVPKNWHGPAFLCPSLHHKHPDLYYYCQDQGFQDACCAVCGWLPLDDFKFDTNEKDRTEGHKVRVETKDEEPKGK